MPICPTCDRHVPREHAEEHAEGHNIDAGRPLPRRIVGRVTRMCRPAYDGSHLPDADVVLAGDDT